MSFIILTTAVSQNMTDLGLPWEGSDSIFLPPEWVVLGFSCVQLAAYPQLSFFFSKQTGKYVPPSPNDLATRRRTRSGSVVMGRYSFAKGTVQDPVFGEHMSNVVEIVSDPFVVPRVNRVPLEGCLQCPLLHLISLGSHSTDSKDFHIDLLPSSTKMHCFHLYSSSEQLVAS
jgi:hypothetical protein